MLDKKIKTAIEDALNGKSNFPELVSETLKYSREKHPPRHSNHECLGVILEEFDELKAAIANRRGNDIILAELASVSAMCQRLAEDHLFR